MKIERNNIEANLPCKGFEVQRDGHHIFFHHIYDGKRTGAYTKVSHSKKFREISDKGGLITVIKRQLKLNTNAQVADLINCPMSEEDYLQHLKTINVISE